jgi:hypothetical protein
MTDAKIDPTQYGFPRGLSQPALRALLAANITTLEQAAAAGAANILKLHGVGPKAIPMLREALAERGLTFVDEPSK